MSDKLATIGDSDPDRTLDVGTFHDVHRGPCIHLTPHSIHGFVQLTHADVEALVAVLDVWLEDHRP